MSAQSSEGPFAAASHRISARPPIRAASSQTRVPPAAVWLGAFGVIPFALLAGAGFVLPSPTKEQVAFALAAYGAVILSFLGGIHWGLAIAESGRARRNGASSSRLTVSVVPALVGWCALLLPGSASRSWPQASH
jgi:hypothetical protein